MPLLELPSEGGQLSPGAKQKIAKSMFSLKECQGKIIGLSKSKKAILFGEDHFNSKLNQFIADMLPKLKEQGFSYLVVERSPRLQQYFDEYQSGKIPFGDFVEKAEGLEISPRAINNYNPYYYDAYLFKKCKENGIRIICADGVGAKHVWTDEERFDYIRRMIPADAKILVDYGMMHVKYDTQRNPAGLSLGQLFKDSFGDAVLSISFMSFGGVMDVPGMYPIGSKKEGAFFTKPFGKTLLDSAPNPLKSFPEKTFFSDYDIIINMSREGTFSEEELKKELINEFFQEKR